MVATHMVEPAKCLAAPMDELLREHFDFVWRLLRRVGVAAASVDDAAQEVFVVAMRKHASIVPGRERSFLYGVALRVAADQRRATARRRLAPDGGATVGRQAAPTPDPEQLTLQKEARAL